MDNVMASSLPIGKLDRSNYTYWLYKMQQYLLGHDYWSYVDGAIDVGPEWTHRDFPAWEKVANRVLYYFSSCVSDQILSYIWDTRTPKDALGNLKKIFVASITTMKLQLRQELSNVRQRDMSVAEYTSKIQEDEMVQVCLRGLASMFGAF